MDEIDVMVFRSLHQEELGDPLSTKPRKSLREVARSLGVDELTVRARLEKLKRQGFLKGWHMFVNPALLGAKLVQVLFDYEDRDADGIIQRLSALPNVTAIVNHIGRSMWVVLVCEDDESCDRNIKTLEGLARTKSSARLAVIFPSIAVKLSPTDVEIITAFSTDPRKLYSGVAEELGLSGRTVRRRMGKLIEEKALFVIPAMDPSALEGALLMDLLVEYSGAKEIASVNRRLLSLLDRYLVRAQFGDKGYAFFNLFITKMSSAREILQTIRSIEGVKDARVDLVQERIELFEHYYGGRRSLNRLVKMGSGHSPQGKN